MKRRNLRERKVSQRMAVIDQHERKQVVAARLEALESDAQVEDAFAAGSEDDEFILRDDSEEGEDEAPTSGRKRKKKSGSGGMRKTRGMLAEKTKGPKTFRDWLEEAELDRQPATVPSYLTAAMGPSRTTAPRKFCSVCGDMSGYTCTRCGSRYCSRRCYTVHSETRCLKFMA